MRPVFRVLAILLLLIPVTLVVSEKCAAPAAFPQAAPEITAPPPAAPVAEQASTKLTCAKKQYPSCDDARRIFWQDKRWPNHSDAERCQWWSAKWFIEEYCE